MQDPVQQRLVNIYFSVVIDEAKVAELVHEETDAGPRRPNHFRKNFLSENDRNDRRAAFLSIVREKQQRASKPFFTRIKKLVDYVFLNATVRLSKWSMKSFENFG
jgi:hypothetical protein